RPARADIFHTCCALCISYVDIGLVFHFTWDHEVTSHHPLGEITSGPIRRRLVADVVLAVVLLLELRLCGELTDRRHVVLRRTSAGQPAVRAALDGLPATQRCFGFIHPGVHPLLNAGGNALVAAWIDIGTHPHAIGDKAAAFEHVHELTPRIW